VDSDPTIDELRRRISALDRTVLHAVNARLRLVSELKAYKDARGLGFLDPDREARMLAELREANAGPLSAEGVERLLRALLELTKREV
jgi:chorismate mutase/prephenate dehydratase